MRIQWIKTPGTTHIWGISWQFTPDMEATRLDFSKCFEINLGKYTIAWRNNEDQSSRSYSS